MATTPRDTTPPETPVPVTVPFAAPQKIVLRPEESVSFSTLTIDRIVVLPMEKQLRVFVKEIARPIILWSGTEYNPANALSIVDIVARLVAVVNSGSVTLG